MFRFIVEQDLRARRADPSLQEHPASRPSPRSQLWRAHSFPHRLPRTTSTSVTDDRETRGTCSHAPRKASLLSRGFGARPPRRGSLRADTTPFPPPSRDIATSALVTHLTTSKYDSRLVSRPTSTFVRRCRGSRFGTGGVAPLVHRRRARSSPFTSHDGSIDDGRSLV